MFLFFVFNWSFLFFQFFPPLIDTWSVVFVFAPESCSNLQCIYTWYRDESSSWISPLLQNCRSTCVMSTIGKAWMPFFSAFCQSWFRVKEYCPNFPYVFIRFSYMYYSVIIVMSKLFSIFWKSARRTKNHHFNLIYQFLLHLNVFSKKTES